MVKKPMTKEQWKLLKKALKGLNDFAKDGKLIFTPKRGEGEMPNEEKKERQK